MRLIVGLQPVREAIAVHGKALRVLVAKGAGPKLDAVARFAEDRGAQVERVEKRDLDRLSKGAYHQNVLAYAPELAFVEVADLVTLERPVVLALDEIEDPQNFGAIVRSAVALGAAAIMWPEHHSAPLSPAMFRASAGAVEHARLCRVSALPSALGELRSAGFSVLGLDASGDRELRGDAAPPPVVLVVGAEGKGLRKPVKAQCDALVRLPMAGPIGSLNASVAAALALYEVTRKL